ncbi:IS630 transposase-related protein, partial [Planctomycetota bacterium]
MRIHISDILCMKAYSIDLRERVLAACDSGQNTIRHVARQFKVSTRWIYKLKQQRKQQGTISPRGHGGGRKPAFCGKDLDALDKYLSNHPDATLQEVREFFSSTVKCSIQAVAKEVFQAYVKHILLPTLKP